MTLQFPGQSERFHLKKMRIDHAEPLQYFLSIDDGPDAAPIYLNELIGAQLELSHSGDICCQACGYSTRKSYGQGHCYRCFKRLARCDLCVMAPHRCHYDKGTCREPSWGEGFCMQPHLVYLANSSGLKVGITREGAQMGRFSDQGALQGRLLARADTRKAAGVLEAELAKSMGDRSQWRSLVSQNAPLLDLDEAAAKARALIPEPGEGVRYVESRDASKTVELHYPVDDWPPVERLNFKKSRQVSGVLQGIKGQYLLFDTGVFNVREHTGFEVVLCWRSAEKVEKAENAEAVAHSASQTDLFEP